MKIRSFSLLTALLMLFVSKVNGQDEVNITLSQDRGCTPFYLDAEGTGTFPSYGDSLNVIYEWTLNGTIIATNTTYIDTMLYNEGYYDLVLTAYDTSGNYLASNYVFIEAYTNSPQIYFPGSNRACPGEQIQMEYHFPGYIYSLQWDFGNGINLNGSFVNTSYDNPGTYTVRLIADTECAWDTLYKQVTIDSNAVPQGYIEYNTGNYVCPNDEIAARISNPDYQVTWELGDSIGTINNKVLRYSYSSYGPKPISAHVTNACGNTNTINDTVFVINTQPADAGFNYYMDNGDNCPGVPVKFDAYASGTHTWWFGDGGTANIASPENIYADTGWYQVTHIVANGCGEADTMDQMLHIEYKPYESSYAETGGFSLVLNGNEIYDYYDTLRICPAEELGVKNFAFGEQFNYIWKVNGDTISYAFEPALNLNTDGYYEIEMEVRDRCQRYVYSDYRYVLVSGNKMPQADLRVLPLTLCPGEEVYFYDEKFEPSNNTNTYAVWYGDGTSDQNITGYSDHPLEVLAYHTYTDTSVNYPFIFSVTNVCGNSDSITGIINVSTDATNVPPYYVGNSTSDGESKPQDWSVRNNPDDHEFIISTVFPDWHAGMNDTFYVFLWYGGFDPMAGDDRQPNGMVEFRSTKMDSGEVISAFVPLSPYDPSEIGIAVGWYCTPYQSLGDEPESVGITMDAQGANIISFPINPGDSTTLINATGGMPITLGAWNGMCNSQSVDGQWKYDNNGISTELDLWEDDVNMNNYYIDKYDNNSDYYENINNGEWWYINDSTLGLLSDYTYDTSVYAFNRTENQLELFVISDSDSAQISALHARPFIPDKYDHDMSGCVGDPVQFQVAGGISYIWDFGDSSPTSTEPYPMHAYDNIGEYEASVIITNACGRVDTVFTHVSIGNTNVPWTGMDIDNYSPVVGQEVNFFTYNDYYTSISYLWDFGDGTTDTVPKPVHIYTQAGQFTATLTVTNGCGSNTEQYMIDVKNAPLCDVTAKFNFNISVDTIANNNTIYFNDASVGANIVSWNWAFGDGSTSTTADPMHEYQQAGVYEVCLSVYDQEANCADQVCKEIVIGDVGCYSDFSYSTNNSTNTISLSDMSEHGTEWYWDFGDNRYSNMKDPSHTYASPGVYTICLSVYDSINDCFDERCKEIWIGEVDTASLCFLDYSFVIDSLSVIFTSETYGNVTSGYWDFGDGNFAYKANPTHTFDKPGVYTVCARIEDSLSGCQAEKCKTVTVGINQCLADFDHYIDVEAATVDFVDRSLGNISERYIDFGDGNYSNYPDTVHTYPSAGLYTVCLVVFNDSTNCYSEICKNINIPDSIGQNCDVDFTYLVEEGTTKVKCFENSKHTFTNWHWDYSNGMYRNVQNPQYDFGMSGVYTVCLNAYDSITDCVSSICKDIVVEGTDTLKPLKPEFNFMINALTRKVKFINNTKGVYNKAYWTFGDGSYNQALDTITHVYKNAGKFNVCLTIVDEDNGRSKQLCKDLVVGEQTCILSSAFEYYIDTENSQYNLIFSDKSTGTPDTWFWNFGDGLTSAKKNPVHAYTEPGYYLVSLSARNSVSGCKDYSAQLIRVGSVDCFADFDYEVDPDNLTVDYTNTSTGTVDYNYWWFGDGNTAPDENPSYTYDQSGLYWVGLAVSDAGGLCQSFNSQFVQVGQVDCSADFELFIDSASQTAFFEGIIIGEATNVVWSFGDGGIAQGLKAQHKYSHPGYFTIGMNTFDASNGCMDYTEKTILIGETGGDVQPEFYYRASEENNAYEVQFFDNSLGDVSSYMWHFGDGSAASTAKNPVHSYDGAGFYNVCLTTETFSGIANTTCKRVKVSSTGNECQAEFIFNVDSTSREVIFTDVSYGDPDTWTWHFNDGQTSTQQHPVINFDTAGVYKARLRIVNSVTGCESKARALINVAKGDVGLLAVFEYAVDSSQLKAVGHPVDIVCIPQSSTGNYSWDMGDGSEPVEGITEFTHVFDTAGTYEVCLTVSDPVTEQSATKCELVTTPTTADTSTTNPTGASYIDYVLQGFEINAYPNPFTDYTRVTYTLPKSEGVELTVIDETGKKMGTIFKTHKDAGKHSFDWDGSFITPGIYMLQLKTESGVIKNRAIVKN